MIHEYKGEQRLILDHYSEIIEVLVKGAKVQSTASSNRIDGIKTSDERLKGIVSCKTMPENRNERKIAGYRDVLNTIHESSDEIPIESQFILRLYQGMCKFDNSGVVDEHESEMPESVGYLCDAYNDAIKDSEADPLILMSMFILDFLCIHPFDDGNERLSRLLTLMLMYKSGFNVGRYISIENLIEISQDNYREALEKSSVGWCEGKNDYRPFVSYMLGVIAAAYRDFFDKTRWLMDEKVSKYAKVVETIKGHLGEVTKGELVKSLPGISQTTIQRTLSSLMKEGEITKINGGRYTKYKWNR